MTELERARARFAADKYATEVTGIEIEAVGEGFARCGLTLDARHYNAEGGVMGGVLFTLADFAFAVASNLEDEVILGIETTMSYMKPSVSGTLFAEATLLSRSKSLQSYDIPVTNEKGELVARFYGRGFVRKPQ